jgi:hypothetical protein
MFFFSTGNGRNFLGEEKGNKIKDEITRFAGTGSSQFRCFQRSAGERSARVAAGKNLPRQIARSETFPAGEPAQLALADQTPTR